LFPSTDTASVPEPFKGLLSNAADGQWVKCPLSKASQGENDWTFLVVPGSLGQVAPQLWNSSFSAAVALPSFPACMVQFQVYAPVRGRPKAEKFAPTPHLSEL